MPPFILPAMCCRLCCVAVILAASWSALRAQQPADTLDVVDHVLFDSVWRASVKAGRLHTDAVDGAAYRMYRYRLAHASPLGSAPRARIAFWCNAWLACLMDVMHQHAGYRSTTWTPDLYVRDTFTIASESFTLQSLRQRIMLEAGNPVVMFALATGSSQSPPFPTHVYTARTVERQLRETARRTCRSERFVFYDPGTNILQLSSLFAAYEPAILTQCGSMVQFVLPYVGEALAAELALRRSTLRVVYGDAIERWIRRR